MSIGGAAIFMNTSFIVLRGGLRGGSVTVFTCTSQDVGVFVCLRRRKSDLPLAGGKTLAAYKMGTRV